MSVATTPQNETGLLVPSRPSTFSVNSGFGIKPNQYKKDNGNLVMEGVAVFRTGTFRDSMGYQNTWESLHMKQMIDNFNHLKSSGVFDDVPVRDGHPGWLINGIAGNGRVVGWHTSLRSESIKAPHDGVEYDYLLADYEILDEDAKRDIASGLWRNRSSEIGTYLSNAEAEFWPVYMGVAYVDIPAVEGLNFSASQAGAPAPKVYVMFDSSSKEKNVGDTPPAAPSQGSQPPAGTQQHGAPAAPAAPAQPFMFTIGGAQVSDYAAVQAHISSLESFRDETTKTNRENFVKALVAGNKIPATKLDAYTKHVSAMSAEQFSNFQDLYGDMEVPSLLGQHGGGVANDGKPSVQHSAEQGSDARKMILTERVRMHSAAGTPKATIEKMDSYRELIALDPSFRL